MEGNTEPFRVQFDKLCMQLPELKPEDIYDLIRDFGVGVSDDGTSQSESFLISRLNRFSRAVSAIKKYNCEIVRALPTMVSSDFAPPGTFGVVCWYADVLFRYLDDLEDISNILFHPSLGSRLYYYDHERNLGIYIRHLLDREGVRGEVIRVLAGFTEEDFRYAFIDSFGYRQLIHWNKLKNLDCLCWLLDYVRHECNQKFCLVFEPKSHNVSVWLNNLQIGYARSVSEVMDYVRRHVGCKSKAKERDVIWRTVLSTKS